MTTTLFGITSLVTHAAFVATTMTGISSANGFLIPESWKTVGKRREGVAAAATGHYYVEEYNTPECRVHMGVTPATPAATTSRGGARIEPTAILVWPVLLLWIILRDSAKLVQHSCAADGEHSKKGLTMHKRPQGTITGTFRGCKNAIQATFCAIATSLVAGIAVSDTWTRAARYCFFTMPWWVRNRLRPQNGFDADVRFFRTCGLSKDPVLLELIEKHMQVRRAARDCLEQRSSSQHQPAAVCSTIPEQSVYGASIITQYILFGDDIFVHARDHELVSAGAHILDDFNDEREDAKLGNLNHFLHHVLVKGKTRTNDRRPTEQEKRRHAEQWVRTMYEVQNRHARTPFGRFIRGTMFYLCYAEDRLRELIKELDGTDEETSIPLPKLAWNDIQW